MLSLNLPELIIRIPAVLLAISFHEMCHGLAAYYLGDRTAKDQGRLTLNPLAHLDPLGTIMLILFRFGWAKPVQVDPRYFRDPHRGMLLVALAGPVSNIVFAYLISLALIFIPGAIWAGLGPFLPRLAVELILINVFLAAFNLLPVPPLDGSKILAGLLPRRYYRFFYQIESYGPVILLLLVMTGSTGLLIGPIVRVIFRLLPIG